MMLPATKQNLLCLLRKACLGRSPAVLVFPKQPVTSFKTFAPLSTDVKTPIQAVGWEYLQRQKASKRPLSPHLGIYEAALTWYVSGMHRVSGVCMGAVVAIMAGGMMLMPFDFPQLIEYIRTTGLPVALVYFIKYIIALSLTFHTLNGIRFLGFDMAKGIDLPSVYRSGWFVVFASLIIAAVLTFWRRSEAEAMKVPAKK